MSSTLQQRSGLCLTPRPFDNAGVRSFPCRFYAHSSGAFRHIESETYSCQGPPRLDCRHWPTDNKQNPHIQAPLGGRATIELYSTTSFITKIDRCPIPQAAVGDDLHAVLGRPVQLQRFSLFEIQRADFLPKEKQKRAPNCHLDQGPSMEFLNTL